MTFEGPDGPFWTSLVLDFDPSDILAGLVLVTPSEGDHVAPVPIPASLWILGSGLLDINRSPQEGWALGQVLRFGFSQIQPEPFQIILCQLGPGLQIERSSQATGGSGLVYSAYWNMHG